MCRPFPLARCVGIAICSVVFLVLLTEAERSEEVDQRREAKESKALGNLSFHQQTSTNISNAAEHLTAGSRKVARQSAIAARSSERAKDSKVSANASIRHQGERNSTRALSLLAAGLNTTSQKSKVGAGADTALVLEGVARPAHSSGKSKTISKQALGKRIMAARAHTRPAHVSHKSKAGLKKVARRSIVATGTHAAMASDEETQPELSGKAREIAEQLDRLSGEMTKADEDAGKVREAVKRWATSAKSAVLSKGDNLASAVDDVAGRLEKEHSVVAQEVTDAARLGDS